MHSRKPSGPPPSRYFRWAVFISRHEYLKALLVFALICGVLGGAGFVTGLRGLLLAAAAIAALGLLLLVVSVAGLYRFYGGPSLRYYRRIVEAAGLEDRPLSCAELHVGTYRHAYALAELLPRATIQSVDCWDDDLSPAYGSLKELRNAELPPDSELRIHPLKAKNWRVPLPDASCDAVVLGVGIHEFELSVRERLFAEAARLLKPRGKVVLFEHVRNLRNALVFGLVIRHWPRRHEWISELGKYFENVEHNPVWPAVDLFTGLSPVNVRALPEILDNRARQTPARLAFTTPTERITWREFADRVDGFALGLAERGLKPGDNVVVMGQTTGEWAIADLGILAAGGVSVGIYPTLPPRQVAHILRDCGAKIALVGSTAEMQTLEAARRETPFVDTIIGWGDAEKHASFSFSSLVEAGRDRAQREPNAVERLKNHRGPEDLALLVYTSGTTGEPKGAKLTHGNCLAQVASVVAAGAPVSERDVTVSFLPMAHVAEHLGLYGRIWTGMATHFVGSLDSTAVLAAIVQTRPTLLGSVPLLFEKAHATIRNRVATAPSVARSLFRWAERTGREMSRSLRKGDRPSLSLRARYAIANSLVFRRLRAGFGGRVRYFLSGAAPIDPDLLEFFHGAGMLILEAYGLTEFCGVATVNRPEAFRFGTVGLPLPGVEVRIAADGEVLLRGPSLFQGYLNYPEETARAISADGWLHSGDVGELDTDGFLRLTDRKKNLVITSGGKKIAPARIESLVAGHALISSVIVVGDGRAYVAALVALGAEVPGVARSAVENQIRAALERANASLAPFERVRRACILPRPLSITEGELTPTLKVRRSVVLDRYRAEIERLYEKTLAPGILEIVPTRT